MSEEMSDAAFKLLADALGDIVSQVIHQAGRDGRICAENVAVMNPPVASCRLGAETELAAHTISHARSPAAYLPVRRRISRQGKTARYRKFSDFPQFHL